jgi:hypothetical protein
MWLAAYLLLSAGLTPALAGTGEDRIQLCWALGALDNTVYFAEVQGREDRQASFADLLDISAIDHRRVECRASDPDSHRAWRTALMKEWSQSEFEIVNTTFMSDLDY